MGPLLEPIVGGLTVLIIFLGISSPIIIIGLIYYLKKRLEHKQIMAAIEKGTPLSELRPPKSAGPAWIKNLTAGIALLIIALGLGVAGPGGNVDNFLVFVLGGVGIAFFIRGLLQRKTQRQIQPSDQSNAGEDK